MNSILTFADVLEAADQLSPDEQIELVAVLKRQIAEAARQRIVADIQEARRDFAARQYKPMTAAEIVGEATS